MIRIVLMLLIALSVAVPTNAVPDSLPCVVSHVATSITYSILTSEAIQYANLMKEIAEAQISYEARVLAQQQLDGALGLYQFTLYAKSQFCA